MKDGTEASGLVFTFALAFSEHEPGEKQSMLLRIMALLALGLGWLPAARAQRSYKPVSVLSSGAWYKLSVNGDGIYKIDLPFLNSLGVNTSNLASASIRIYGNGGRMLSESNAGPWVDDLQENAISVNDGGDGILNGADYILFYAQGPDHWQKDSINQRFRHQKNLYSDKSFYFLTIAPNGKRIQAAPVVSSPNLAVTSFSERYFHELDTVNFLSSGKEWYGEELSSLPGRSLSRSFPIPLDGLAAGSALQVLSDCVARSVGGGSRFDVKVNNAAIGQVTIAPIGTGQYDLFAQQGSALHSTTAPAGSFDLVYTYNPGSFNAQGWINWFEVFCRRSISLAGKNQLFFRDWTSVGSNIAEFVVANANTTTEVWDITDPYDARRMQGAVTGSELRFVNHCSRLREYVAFHRGNLPAPRPEGRVQNQNLHRADPTDYIIITHPDFLQQAQRLAQFHQQRNGLRTTVVTTQQVFDEFAGGNPDPVAIRDFVKMYFDKFRGTTDSLKYLLLFGDASFDFKDRLINNTNLVPSWENNFSLDPLATYVSDDFFGFLDDHEDINSGAIVNYLDIGIGRVPATNAEEAKNFVDKLEAYFSPESLGPWRNDLTFIADDEDQNLHLQDAEIITATAAATAPAFNQDKVYLDAFRQQSGSGGSSYPDANQAINNQVFNGTLVWNFTGHGGPRRLAEETILDQEIINNWNNANRLPLFITATCDFAPFDIPQVNSVGENVLLRPKTGAIALMTTTRVVFAYSNRIMNNNYMRFALEPDASGRYRSLGEAVRDAKNYTYQTSADIANNRKFALLGDPAMTLAFPRLKIRVTSVNAKPATQADTLSAKEKVTVEGEVTDLAGTVLSSFNGSVYQTVFDKPRSITTLANDPGSQPASFSAFTNILFKGKATVSNGRFSFTFRVPKDINYQHGNGRLSLYAENGAEDANGLFTNFFVGGTSGAGDNDDEGPEIRPYLNDESFANGGLTNENPVLIVKLADSSGINTVGTGVGHDIVGTLDNDNRTFFLLNDYYRGDDNSYQRGTVRFQMPPLGPGPHTLKIKAWDVMNNSNEAELAFIVAKDEELRVDRVLNYPNPFTTKTQFWFEHNKPGQDLVVRVQIFTLTGRVIKVINRTINTAGNRSNELEWDGRDEYGDKAARGVYLYKLSVIGPGKLRKEKVEKLVIF